MTNYNDVFGGDTVPPSQYSYAKYENVHQDVELVWPENYGGTGTLCASIVEISANPNLYVALPPSDQVSLGRDVLIRNIGANDFTLTDAQFNTVAVVSPGTVKYLYVTDNSSVAGLWAVFTYGTGTSAADAAALAGGGLMAIGGKLNQVAQVVNWAGNYSVAITDRAKVFNIMAGSVTITLPPTATVESGYFVSIRNSSAGEVLIDGAGTETIDGSLNKALAPGEALTLHSTGNSWITTGYGRDVTFAFSEFVIDASTATHNLTSTQVAGRMLRVSGTATAPVQVTVPALDNIYFVNVEAGMGIYQVTFTTGLGTTVSLSASQQTVLYSDGTNLKTAVNTALTPLSGFADGVVGAPSLYFLLDTNTGIYRPGDDIIGFSAGGSNVFSVGTTGNTSYENLNFSGTELRLEGDLSSSRISDRLHIQSNVADSPTSVGVIPNGTNQQSAIVLNNSSSPTNSSRLNILVAATETSLRADRAGSGAFLPMTFHTNDAERLRLDTSGNVIVPSGGTLRGDFSNGTLSSRTYIQTSTTNAASDPGVLPNGTSTTAAMTWYAGSNPDNAPFIQVSGRATEARITSGVNGAGSVQPMTFFMGGSEFMRLTSSGHVGLGTATPNYNSFSRAATIEGSLSAGLELASTRADAAAALVGAVDFQYRTNAVNHNRLASVQTVTEGSTINQRGGAVTIHTKADASTALVEQIRINSSGDLKFSSTGQRIIGDFSNSTVSNRVHFQSTASNNQTAVGIIPNGTNQQSFLVLNNAADPSNASRLDLTVNATESSVRSNKVGTGTYLPMTFYTNGSERMRLSTAGDLGIGTTSPNYAGYSHALTVEGSVNAALELSTTRADVDGASVGALEWNFRSSSANHQRIAAVSATAVGATANQRGGNIIFSTKANGSTSLSEVGRIDGNGRWILDSGPASTFNAGAPNAKLLAFTSANGTPATSGSVDNATAMSFGMLSVRADMGVYASGNFWIQPRQITNLAVNFSMSLCPNGGNVGFGGNVSPQSSIDNNGFSKLGDVAPSIKQKKLTGTTGATQGSNVAVAHGLTLSKIIAIQPLVNDVNGSKFSPAETILAGYQYGVYADSTNITLYLHPTNSSNILSKAFTILITYEA